MSINLLIYIIGCGVSFILFWLLMYFENYLAAKYTYKTNTVEFDITVIDVVASLFFAALSVFGIVIECIFFLMLIIELILDYLYTHKKAFKVLKKIRINYHWYDKH